MMTLRRHKMSGFTLIELMVVVAIVAILAAVAYPSYTAQVRKNTEVKVRGDLMDLVASLETWRSQNFEYTNSLSNLGSPLASDDNYTVTITLGANNQTFDAVAVPKTGSIVEGEATFKINEEGATCYKVNSSGCTIGSDPTWKER